jgi:hypothetical protein
LNIQATYNWVVKKSTENYHWWPSESRE